MTRTEEVKEVSENTRVKLLPYTLYIILVFAIGATFTFTNLYGDLKAKDVKHTEDIHRLDSLKADKNDLREIKKDLKLIKKRLGIDDAD